MPKINDKAFKIKMMKDELAQWNIFSDDKARRERLAKILTEKLSLDDVYHLVLKLRGARGEIEPLFEFRRIIGFEPLGEKNET